MVQQFRADEEPQYMSLTEEQLNRWNEHRASSGKDPLPPYLAEELLQRLEPETREFLLAKVIR